MRNFLPDKRKPDKRRLLAALCREKGRGIPNFEIVIDPRSVSHILGRPDLPSTSRLPPEVLLELLGAIGQDAAACPLSYYPETYGLVHKRGDEKKLSFPDPGDKYQKLKSYCDCFAGSKAGVIAQLSGCFTPAYMSFGPIPIQDFMCLLYDDETFACRLMDLYRDYTLKIIETIKPLAFDAFYIGDDISSGGGCFISPAMLDSLWAPRMKEIVQAAKASGRPVIIHCCGDQAPILPYMREWKVDAVHPLQPPVNDIYKIAETYGPDITLIGNIDVATVLTFGTPEDVYEDTLRHIELAGKTGGYVVCSSHSIIDSIPPQNFLAMVRAAHDANAL